MCNIYKDWPTNLHHSLSHLSSQKDTIKLPNLYVYQIANQFVPEVTAYNKLEIATQEDDELVLLKCTITQGWPSTIKEFPSVYSLIGHSERN